MQWALPCHWASVPSCRSEVVGGASCSLHTWSPQTRRCSWWGSWRWVQRLPAWPAAGWAGGTAAAVAPWSRAHGIQGRRWLWAKEGRGSISWASKQREHFYTHRAKICWLDHKSTFFNMVPLHTTFRICGRVVGKGGLVSMWARICTALNHPCPTCHTCASSCFAKQGSDMYHVCVGLLKAVYMRSSFTNLCASLSKHTG